MSLHKPRLGKRASSPFGRPLRAMFLLTSVPIGGAETLLTNLVRRFDPSRIQPMIGCMKHQDELGKILAEDFPVYENLLHHKYDLGVVRRLRKLLLREGVDALITVGAGDKMFWGRLAAAYARLPVVLSALHSTGWPDGVGKLNRWLTPITDGFIAVAKQHAEFQIQSERFPEEKVFLVPNGIDTDRFQYCPKLRQQWRAHFGIRRQEQVVGIVAALRPEKNHALFLRTAKRVLRHRPGTRFVIVGDGPERDSLESLSRDLEINEQVLFTGAMHDIPGMLSMSDIFALTSDNEASPVSIMEALACERPVVATNVGSISETVRDGKSGFLVSRGDEIQMARRWEQLLGDDHRRKQMGKTGRSHVVENSSLQSMTDGYTQLIETTYAIKTKSLMAPGPAPQNEGHSNGWVGWDYQLHIMPPLESCESVG